MAEQATADSGPVAQPALTVSEQTGYGIVLCLLLAAVALSIVSPATGWTFVAVVALEGAAVVTARSTARPKRGFVWPLLIALVIVTIAASAPPAPAARIAAGALDFVLLLWLPAIIVIRFRRALYVTAESVLGAITVYLVVGLLYTVLDPTFSLLLGQRFFTQQATASLSQYTYFSFITLCTVGYGDLTPASGFARMLAVSEALLGQLYLVTVIALVVSNVGRQRQPRRRPEP